MADRWAEQAMTAPVHEQACTLLALLLNAPLVGDADDGAMHAVDTTGIHSNDGRPTTFTARCGAQLNGLVADTYTTDTGPVTAPALWPPYANQVPGNKRCRTCLQPGDRPGQRTRYIG